MRARRRGATIATVAVLLVLPACGSSGGVDRPVAGCSDRTARDTTAEALRIVTTVAPITDIVASIAAGTGAHVDGIVPEGTDSHSYEPAPSDAASLERADIVFMNGLGLEAPTRDLAVANLRDDAVLCELGDTVLPEAGFIFDFSFPESGGRPNPHLWTSPARVGDYATVVHDVLAAAMPDHGERLAANLASFIVRVDALDVATHEATATIPAERRRLVTYHDAYAYFARDYGWTVIGAVQPSSFAEPTPREVAQLIAQIRDADVPVIFGSEVFPSPVLEQIAAETGVVYVDDLRDDDLPGEPGDVDHSWFGLMRFNLTTIVEAFGGDASSLRELRQS